MYGATDGTEILLQGSEIVDILNAPLELWPSDNYEYAPEQNMNNTRVRQSRDRTWFESKKLQVIQNNGVVAGYKNSELLIKSTRFELLFIKCTSPRNAQNQENYELPIVLYGRGL